MSAFKPLPCNKLSNLRRRANRARRDLKNTCPASRHVHLMADNLSRYGGDRTIVEDAEHAAGSLYSVLENLWKARNNHNKTIAKLRKKLDEHKIDHSGIE